MAKNTSPTQFKKGQQVVYPLQGVGLVENIEERSFKGEMVPYYVMYFDVSDMTIRIPVATAAEQGFERLSLKRIRKKHWKSFPAITNRFQPTGSFVIR
jgi:CarD family transcriptional regulator